jgi:flagellum-specific peptidoglycan hydrolase FlgJ
MRTLLLVVMLCFLIFGDRKISQQIPKENEPSEVTNETFAKNISDNFNPDTEHPFIVFCDKYQEIAILFHLKYGIPVSIQLAQAITESGGGKSELSRLANNLFGMKYYKEIFDGDYYQPAGGDKWRKYDSFEDSFEDHAIFLNKYYNHAVGKNWMFWVNNCKGYGGPGYWKHIGDVIVKYKLYEYDNVVDFSIKLQKTYYL